MYVLLVVWKVAMLEFTVLPLSASIAISILLSLFVYICVCLHDVELCMHMQVAAESWSFNYTT